MDRFCAKNTNSTRMLFKHLGDKEMADMVFQFTSNACTKSSHLHSTKSSQINIQRQDNTNSQLLPSVPKTFELLTGCGVGVSHVKSPSHLTAIAACDSDVSSA